MGQKVQRSRQPVTVKDHIRELMLRLLVTLLVMTAAGVVVFLFYAPILSILSVPLGHPLYYSNPAGSFSFVMKICFTGALIITIPVLIFNLIMFIRPAFKKVLSIKRILITTGASTILAITGAFFAFYCILPGTLKFFNDFQVSGLKALISADSYLGFITNLIIMFVIVFQIPLIVMFIDHIKPLSPTKLLKKGKWVVLGSLIITIIQPFTYDLVTSLFIALPIIVLYYLSIALVAFQHVRIKHSIASKVNAVITKPSELSIISLDNLRYEDLADELAKLEKPKPLSTLPSGCSVMDVKKTKIQAEEVKPAAWVEERKARRAALLNQKSHVFSDFRPVNRSNRALA